MNGICRFRYNIFNSMIDLIQIFCHLRKCNIKKQRKKDQITNNHEKCLVISDQLPVKMNRRLFIYIQKYQNIYKSSGKTVIINSIDHKLKQYPPYQNGKRCDQHRLKEDTEF